MTDRPILFSAPMVRALLDGRKTQTRRLAWSKRQPSRSNRIQYSRRWDGSTVWQKAKPGDRLWVRENWYGQFWDADDIDGPPREHWDTPRAERTANMCSAPWYQATEEIKSEIALRFYPENQWAPSIHMPRWASRLTLVVTETRRERLQEISSVDAEGEGVRCDMSIRGFRDHFAALWDRIHGAGAWDDNPEIIALTFTVHQRNIDALTTTPEEGTK